MESWIVERIRSCSQRRLIAWALTLAAVVLLALGQSRYLRNFALGPYAIGAAELDAIQDVSQAARYYVTVTGEKALETGVQQITVRKRNGVETSRSVTAAYYALVLGNRYLVCKRAAGPLATTFVGELEPMPAELQANLFNTPQMQAARSRFYAFYLNDDSFRLPGILAIVGVLVLAIFFVRAAVPAWRHLSDPGSHPVVKRVQGWGDPIGTAVAAERESHATRFSGGGWRVTDQFLIQSSFFRFDLYRLSDLLWAYKTVTQHRVNFIPTGKTYAAALFCYGGAATVPGNEKTVDAILGFAAARAPWAIFGFSKDLQKLFKTQTKEFCAAVEKRRQEHAQGARAGVARPR